jgi:hypothetical protein
MSSLSFEGSRPASQPLTKSRRTTPPAQSFLERLAPVLLSLAVLLVAWLAFSPSLKSYFVADDFHYLRPLEASRLWRLLLLGRDRTLYRPLCDLLMRLEFQLWGLQPLPYHLLRLGIHVANALLAAGLLLRCGRGRALAAVTGLIFVAHPSHGGIVPWVSNIFELCALFFELLTLHAMVSFLRRPRATLRGLAPVVLLSGAALLSKGTAVMLPGLILVTGLLVPRSRRTLAPPKPGTAPDGGPSPEGAHPTRARRRAGWNDPSRWGYALRLGATATASALVVALYLLYRVLVLRSLGVYGSTAHLRLGAFLLEHLALYWRQSWFPTAETLSASIAAGVIAAVFLLASSTTRLGLLWFCVALFPAMNLTGERFLYAPVLGNALGLSWLTLLPLRLRRATAARPSRSRARLALCSALLGLILSWGIAENRLAGADWTAAGKLVRSVPELMRASIREFDRETTVFIGGLPRRIGRAFAYSPGIALYATMQWAYGDASLRVFRITSAILPRIPVPPPGDRLLFLRLRGRKVEPITELQKLFAQRQQQLLSRPPRMPDWDLADPSTRADWDLHNQLQWRRDPHDGWAHLISLGDDPFMLRQELELDMRPIYGLRIIGSVRDEGPYVVGAVYWITREDPVWTEQKRVLYTMPADGRFHEIIVPLFGQPGWSPWHTLIALRLDPAPRPTDLLLTRISLLSHGFGRYQPALRPRAGAAPEPRHNPLSSL